MIINSSKKIFIKKSIHMKYKLITRNEANELVKGTFTDELNKVVLYGEVSGNNDFVVSENNRDTGLPYRANQGLIGEDIRKRTGVNIILTPAEQYVLSTSTTVTFNITADVVGTITSTNSEIIYNGQPLPGSSVNLDWAGGTLTGTIPANTGHAAITITASVTASTADASNSASGQCGHNATGFITLNPTGRTVHSTATTDNFTFATNCNGIVLTSPTNITGSGITGSNVSVAFGMNTAAVEQTRSITVSGTTPDGEGLSATYEITQSSVVATAFTFTYNGNDLSQASGSTNNFTMALTNAVLSAVVKDTNYSTDYTIITGGTTSAPTLMIDYEANLSANSRQFRIIARATDVYGSLHEVGVAITQAADSYTLTLSADSLSVTSYSTASTFSFAIDGLTDTGYTPTGLTVTNIDSQTGKISVTYSQNTGNTPLTLTLEISGKTGAGQSVSASASFTQSAAVDTDFSFTCQTPYIGPGSGSTSGLSMTFTNSSLSSVTVPQGCSYSTGGTATQMILTFTYVANTGSDVKTYTITAVATDVYNRQISRSVTITQLSESINFISVTPDGTSIGPEASSVTFGVSWNYASTGTQITFTTEDGITTIPTPISVESMNGSSNITVQISENDTDSGRTPRLTATMTDVASGSHSDSGSYVQEAKVSKFNFGKDVTVDHIATSTAATYSYQYIQSNSADLIVEGGAYFDTEHTQTATTINISSNVKGSGSIRIYFDENPEGGDRRTFTITASGMEDDEGEPVTGKTSVDITQLGYQHGMLDWYIPKTAPRTIPSTGGKAMFVVGWLGLSTNNNYIVVNSGMTVLTRVKVTRENSNPLPEANRTFEVIIGENTTGSDRVLQFPLTTTDKWGQEVRNTAEITQSGGI